MYLNYFGFKDHPFAIAATSEHFFPGAGRKEIFEQLLTFAAQPQGMAIITGDTGCGKSHMARYIKKNIDKSTTIITHTAISNQNVRLSELLLTKLPTRPNPAKQSPLSHQEEDTIPHLFQLEYHLKQRVKEGQYTILLIDSAEYIALESLNELRCLMAPASGKPLLGVILFGRKELSAKLSSPIAKDLTSTICLQKNLTALPTDAIMSYLTFRLQAAGGNPELFSQDALDELAKNSQGLVRRIHILAHNSLLVLYARKGKQIQASDIQDAARMGEPLLEDLVTHIASHAKRRRQQNTQPSVFTLRNWLKPLPISLLAGSLALAWMTTAPASIFHSLPAWPQWSSLMEEFATALPTLANAHVEDESTTGNLPLIMDIPPRPIQSAFLPSDDCQLAAPARSAWLPKETKEARTTPPAAKETRNTAPNNDTKPVVASRKETPATPTVAPNPSLTPGQPNNPPTAKYSTKDWRQNKLFHDLLQAGKSWIAQAKNNSYTVQLIIIDREESLRWLENVLQQQGRSLASTKIRVLPLPEERYSVYINEFPSYPAAKIFLAQLKQEFKNAGPFVIKIQDVRKKIALNSQTNKSISSLANKPNQES